MYDEDEGGFGEEETFPEDGKPATEDLDFGLDDPEDNFH